LWVACGLLAVLVVQRAEANPGRGVIQDTTYRSVSQFGPDTLLIRELVFDGVVKAAQVDGSTGNLLISVRGVDLVPTTSIVNQGMAQDVLLAYDLEAHHALWEKASTLLPVSAAGQRAVMRRGNDYTMLRVADGRELGDVDGEPFLWTDRVALGITSHEIRRWDPESGRDMWRADREVGGSLDQVIRQDTVAYLVANGIQKVDLRTGPVWSYAAKASRKGLFSDGFGQTFQLQTLYGGSRATNLTAPPLIGDRDVFFAADTTVVKLDASSGAVRWTRKLTRPRGFSLKERALGTSGSTEFLGRLSLRDAGRNILVASLGWASGPKYSLVADPPSVALLDKRHGDLVARVQVPGVTFLNDVLSTPAGNFVVSFDRVVAFDDSLRVRATWMAPIDLRPLGFFVAWGDGITLTSGPGIVALSADSLGVLWSARLGRVLTIDHNFGSPVRYCVTTQGLVRLGGTAGLQPNAYYPVRGTWAEIRDGWLLLGAGNRLRVATLLPRQPAPRLD
jgi:hypothetical protein